MEGDWRQNRNQEHQQGMNNVIIVCIEHSLYVQLYIVHVHRFREDQAQE